MKLPASFLLTLLASSVAAQAHVVVVGGAGSDYTDLQAAVLAEPDASVFLVKAGTYGAVSASRAISIFAEGNVRIRTLELTAPTSDSGFVLRGFECISGLSQYSDLRIFQTPAPVWIEDVVLSTGLTLFFGVSGAVTMTRCSTSGIIRDRPPVVGGAESLSIYDSSLVGGTASGSLPLLVYGSAAISGGATSGLLVSGSNLRGSDGLDPYGIQQIGGDAIKTTSLVRALDSELVGGVANGKPVSSGTVVELPGDSRSLVIPSSFVEGSTFVEEFHGRPGDLAFLGFSFTQNPLPAFAAELSGSVFLGAPFALTFKGIIPSSGTLESEVFVANQGLGHNGLVLYMQAAFLEASGTITLSNPTAGLLKGSLIP